MMERDVHQGVVQHKHMDPLCKNATARALNQTQHTQQTQRGATRKSAANQNNLTGMMRGLSNLQPLSPQESIVISKYTHSFTHCQCSSCVSLEALPFNLLCYLCECRLGRVNCLLLCSATYSGTHANIFFFLFVSSSSSIKNATTHQSVWQCLSPGSFHGLNVEG